MGVHNNCVRTGQCGWKSCGKPHLPGWTMCKKHRASGKAIKTPTPRKGSQ